MPWNVGKSQRNRAIQWTNDWPPDHTFAAEEEAKIRGISTIRVSTICVSSRFHCNSCSRSAWSLIRLPWCRKAHIMRIFRPVHLLWTLANLSFSLILAVAWWLTLRPVQPPPVAAEPVTITVPALPQGSVRFVAPGGPRGPLGVLLSAPLAGTDPWSDLPETILNLTPKVPGRLRLRAPDRMEFTPESDWPAATAITAVLDPDAPTSDGCRLGAQATTFIANPLFVEGVTLLTPPKAGPAHGQRVRLRCNHAVTASALAAALSVAEVWEIAGLGADTRGEGPWADFPVDTLVPAAEGATWQIHLAPIAGIDPTDPRLGSLTLRCAGSLVAAAGGAPMGVDAEYALILHDRVAVQDLRVVDGGILLRCRSQLALPTADQLTLTPPRAVTWERRWDGLLARCELEPGESVRVQMPLGFPGHGRYRLAAAIDDVLRVGDAQSRLRLVQRGSVLSTHALPFLDLEATNLDRLDLRLRRVYDNNQVRFAERDWRVGDAACSPWRLQEQRLTSVRNRSAVHAIDLRSIWGDATLPTGWYEVEVHGFDSEHHRQQVRTVVQISDIACAVRADGGDIVVRAWSLADGTPLNAVEVQVLTPTNQRLVDGLTDDVGLCRLRHPTTAADQCPYVLLLRHGDDRLAIDLTRFRMELVDGQLAGERDPDDGLVAWVWSERGLVRPGEPLRVVGLVRDETGRAPLGESLEWRLFDPAQRRAASTAITLSADGLLSHHHDLPAQAVQGTWRWELWRLGEEPRRLAGTWTRVESFVPDRIVATATLGPFSTPSLIADRAALHLAATVHATTGEALAGATIEARLRIAPATAIIPGRADFGFGLTQGMTSEVPPGVIAERRLVSDASGAVRWALNIPNLPGVQAVEALVDGAALDPGGRALPIAARATVLTVATVLGVRGVAVSGGIEAEVLACEADGLARDLPAAVTLRVERRRWEWDMITRHGRHDWRTSIRRDAIAQVAVTQAGPITIPIDGAEPAVVPGSWLVVVLARDGVDYAEQIVGGHPPARPDRLRVTVADPGEPGGSVAVEVVSPLAGRALATIEGRGIHHAAVVDLVAGPNHLEFPLPGVIDRPNLHVVIVVAAPQRGHADGALWLAGAAPVPIARKERELAVTLIVSSDVDPSQTMPITVLAPGAQRAVVVAVDEAVLARTRHPVPDPAARFRSMRALSGIGATSLADLLERPLWKEAPGGDGDDDDPFALALTKRSADLDHLGACARWAVIDLDAQGQGTVAWDIADFEGRLRVVVIAAGAQACGAATSSSLVRAPIGIRLAVPRVIAPGDTVQALVTVTARAEAGPALIHIDGGAAFAVGPLTEIPVLERDVPVMVPVVLTARHADAEAGITVTVRQSGGERTTRTRLPVRPAARWVEEQYQIPLTEARDWRPEGDWQGEVQVRLRPARDRRDELRSALALLMAYPYGCGEQTASQTLVMATCAELADTDADRARSRTMLAHGVAHLRTLEHGNGFAWWRGDRSSDPILTVLIVRALLAAEAAGSTLEPVVRQRWLQAVEHVVRRDERTLLRCQAVAVLARGGQRVATWIDVLGDRATTVEELAWLALAAARTGDQERALELMRGSDATTAVNEREFDGLLRTPLRCAAIELSAWLAVEPGHGRVPILAERLLAAVRRPRNLTTQELSQVLPALTAWCAIQSQQPAPGDLLVDGVPVDSDQGWSGPVAAPLHLATSAPTWLLVDVQGWRQDAGGPNSDGVSVQRHWRRWSDGEAVEALAVGHVYAVELVIDTPRPLPAGVLTDLLPAGYEVEAAPGPTANALGGTDLLPVRHRHNHDDRVLLVFDAVPAGRHRFIHAVRTLLPGTFHAGPPAWEAFYDPTLTVAGAAASITVAP